MERESDSNIFAILENFWNISAMWEFPTRDLILGNHIAASFFVL